MKNHDKPSCHSMQDNADTQPSIMLRQDYCVLSFANRTLNLRSVLLLSSDVVNHVSTYEAITQNEEFCQIVGSA